MERHRLPEGMHWGRCLLVVAGKTLISGRCAYEIREGGDFSIHGPRQVYGGIDYPAARGGAEERSRDYWASVHKDPDGTWRGYGNFQNIRGTHGGRDYALTKNGACYAGEVDAGETDGGEPIREAIKVCLWRP